MNPRKNEKRAQVPARPAPRRPIFPWVLLALAAATVAALVMLRPTSPGQIRADGATTPDAGAEGLNSRTRTAVLPPEGETKTVAAAPGSARPDATPSPTPEVPAEPEPEMNAKIDYIIEDFRGYSKNLDGYKLEGLERTNDGLVLAPKGDANTSESDGFRRGTIESPVLPFNYPSNAVQPIWRARLPGNETSLQVEIALSADAENWSQWYQMEPSGDDIAPTYPDGRPNPNYGAVSGNIVSNGLRLFPYMRYRVTLASTAEDATPLLEEFKVTYLDSTAGEGYLADQEPPQAVTEERAATGLPTDPPPAAPVSPDSPDEASPAPPAPPAGPAPAPAVPGGSPGPAPE